MKIKIFIFIISTFLNSSISAEENDEFDFGSHDQESLETNKEFNLKVTLSLKSAYQVDAKKRWMYLGPSLKLQGFIENDLGNINYDSDILFNLAHQIEDDPENIKEHYNPQLSLRELYWQKSFENFSIKVGQLIVVWGKADALVVTDVLTPKDYSLLFFGELDNRRIGQLLLEYDYYYKDLEFNFYFIPTPLYDRLPPLNHPSLGFNGVAIPDSQFYKIRDNNHEFAIRINNNFQEGSVALMLAAIHNREPVINLKKFTKLEFIHKRYFFSGLTTNFAFGPILIKSELAFEYQKASQSIKNKIFPNFVKANLLAWMTGIDYNHNFYGSFIFEYSGKGPLKSNKELLQSKIYQYFVSAWSRTFFNENLNLNISLTFYDDFKNIFTGISSKYSIIENFNCNFSYNYMDFNSDLDDLFLSGMDGLDRVSLTLSYIF